jgi:hypothetical protein
LGCTRFAVNDITKSTLRWLVGLPARLVLALILTGVLAVMLVVLVGGLHIQSGFVGESLMRLLILALLAGYTWAVYFGLPFFCKRARWQRVLISSVPAAALLFLTYLAAAAVICAVFFGKSDQRVESVTLPSGEVLENHTHSESGFPDGVRINELFLKNPATGTSERVDSNGNLDYEYNDSLLVRFPHPQEFIYGDEKVLVIGSYLCQRIKFGNVPCWNITSIDFPTEAQAYLKSFFSTNDYSSKNPSDIGLEGGRVPFVFASLDLTNNVLTLKKQMPEGYGNWQQFRQHPDSIFWDEFPSNLVFSATVFNGGSIYQFPFKFDLARTKAMNGPLWDNSTPPDSSSITIRSAKFGAKTKTVDVTARVVELLNTNSDGFTVNTNTLGCDPFPRVKKHLTIEYGFKGFNFASTNANGAKVSYQTLINNARK